MRDGGVALSRSELSDALFTDLYQLTMAQAYWQNDVTGEATFDLYFRNFPPNRAYYVFTGLEDILDYLQDFSFRDLDLSALDALGIFDQGFLDFLSKLRFTGRVRSMSEGTLLFADEPVLEVSGPIIECQLAETFIVNQISLQTMLATKAARMVHAAQGRLLVDFAARRTHGTDSAMKLARSSYIVGFVGTSNVRAAATYGIQAHGTMAHSFVSAFPTEADSFRAYGQSFPESSTFLVDTYDTESGVRNAVDIANEMKQRGHTLRAVRLDSGDLLELSKVARGLLDEAGLGDVMVLASGGLDEYSIEALVKAGAPIGGFGVGTRLGSSADAPNTEFVYKLVAFEGKPVVKLSSQKANLPGAKQAWREIDDDGLFRRDIVMLEHEPTPSPASEPLLHKVMQNGKASAQHPDLDEMRQRFQGQFERLPERFKELEANHSYDVIMSEALQELTDSTQRTARRQEST
ncbi:MAG: nicotinate phosphoribosyltransferase [SAR202 cluster bacterium]|nr:nicotinate phosphoribosyltransferase [SAR202 cluster bacterium]|tara:strand:- start:4939 stop:6327 length:1389 start_codon:yes stop_codon:yes gene_type:complete